MKKLFIASALVTAAVMTGCAPKQNNTSADVLEGEWDIISYATDSAVVELGETSKSAPYVHFNLNEQAFYGNAGCNLLRGELSTDSLSNALTLGNVASTRMMCPSMEVEDAILTNLGKVAAFQTAGENESTVELLDAHKNVVITLAKRANYSEIAGKWNFFEINGEEVNATEEEVPFMEFEIDTPHKRFFGNAGCNNFNGEYTLESDHNISFEGVAITEMACENMKMEETVMAALAEVASYSIEEGQLSLLNAEKKVVLKLIKG